MMVLIAAPHASFKAHNEKERQCKEERVLGRKREDGEKVVVG